MALMAAQGEITPMPAAAIFADTQSEPQSVYSWLDWLETQLPFPVIRVTKGNLGSDFLRALESAAGRCGQPPFFVIDSNNKVGVLRRKCTSEYKLAPIRRKVRELRDGMPVSQWIGISLDECHRMKPSDAKYITHRYPLVDLKMTRQDCLNWMKKNGYPKPPKSACFFCPYSGDARLREMRDTETKEWDKLIKYDQAIREKQSVTANGANIKGKLFVHRTCRPIEKVDLSIAADYGQTDLFGNECIGMCGV